MLDKSKKDLLEAVKDEIEDFLKNKTFVCKASSAKVTKRMCSHLRVRGMEARELSAKKGDVLIADLSICNTKCERYRTPTKEDRRAYFESFLSTGKKVFATASKKKVHRARTNLKVIK